MFGAFLVSFGDGGDRYIVVGEGVDHHGDAGSVSHFLLKKMKQKYSQGG